MAASRTDTGVHARGQVVSFWAESTLDAMTLVRALNYYLPGDIAVRAAYRAGDSFSVRGDALSREYRYHILSSSTRSPFSRRFALFMPKILDIQTMNEACQLVQGEHDFEKKGDFTVFRIVANSFLPHQVRSTVGLLVRLGLGKIGIADFRDIMEARNVGLAGPVSPACGLCLARVNYARPLGS
jgi:tRNA pseudouridine38-40 synthase